MTNMTGSKLSIFSYPGKITGYWITTRSFPYRGPHWPGPMWASTLSQANMGVSFLDVGICNKYFNTWAFPYWPGYHPSTHIGPPLRLGPIWGSRDNQANMEMPMYYSVYMLIIYAYIILYAYIIAPMQ
jgi:hypothetical protein